MEPSTSQPLPVGNFWKKMAISVISLILFVSVITYAVYETTKATVTVSIDDETVTVKTHASTVAELMMEQEWKVEEHDHIEPGLDTEITGNMTIDWIKPKQVFVTIDGKQNAVWTFAENVEELIDELEIDYKEQDIVEPKLDKAIIEDMDIVYESSFPVELTSDGETEEIWTTSTTVADFLERENISLGELDRVEPELKERIDGDIGIQVIRVEKVTDVVEEAVTYGTVTRKDDQLKSGEEKILQEGKRGSVEKHYEVVLEDGKEVSRELIKTETVKESKDKIVAIGTKQPVVTASRSQSPVKADSKPQPQQSQQEPKSSGRTITVTATAYTAGCSGCSGVTATGINLNKNRNMKVIAVDPSVIPLGTRVHVEGYGNAIAGDTGGAITGNKIDVHVPTKADANNWGRKTVKVTILN